MDFHFIWSKLTGLNGAIKLNFIDTEAVARRCSVKKVFLEISQNSQENTSANVSLLIKLQALDLQLYSKRDSGTGVSL